MRWPDSYTIALGATHRRLMPRLTTPTYLFQHHQLKALWAQDQDRYAFLSWNDQLDLRKYYLLTLDKTEVELVAHRRNVHLGDPSLPQRGGRAYALLRRGEKAKVSYGATPSGRFISVRPLMRPAPDLRLLAKAVLWMAIREAKERESRDRAAQDLVIIWLMPAIRHWRPQGHASAFKRPANGAGLYAEELGDFIK